MKRLIITLAAAFAALNLFAMNDDGHKLTQLWQKYEEARKADKPKTEAEILTQIKQEASQKRYAVDFYDAATQYVEAVGRRNWKEREPARQALEHEIAAYGDPMVTFTYMDQYCREGVKTLKDFANKYEFAGHNPAFYRGVSTFLAGVLPHFIKDDAEYVLWRLLCRDFSDKDIIAKLRENIEYPKDAALDYFLAVQDYDKDNREKKMVELARKYDGTAAGLLPQSQVLRARFSKLEDSKDRDDAPYKTLYQDCKAFEKKRAAFKGDEKLIADKVTAIDNLIGTLEYQAVDIMFDNGDIVVLLRNLPEAKVSLFQDGSKKAMKTWTAKNAANSFYVRDSVKIALPTLVDGEYTAEAVNGKRQATAFYEQYTLSIATRRDSKGLNVYVADFKTGKPIKTAKVYLCSGSDVVASTTMTLDGFTPVPASITKRVSSKRSYQLYVENGKRKSTKIWLGDSEDWYSGDTKEPRCNIYRDRGAYNPGDELQFKAVVYAGDPMTKLQALEGKKLTAILLDSEGNELEKLSLKTNQYGSVSGKFTIPKGLRNGRFSLEILDGKRHIGYSSFRVDEFVLPTFEMAFDSHEKLFLQGDDVPVSGSVKSYSGHKLTGARAIMTVQRHGTTVMEEEKEIGADNLFSFIVPKVETGWYGVTVKVVDPTGETMERSTGFYIGTELSVGMTVENAAEGEFTLMQEEPVRPYYRWRPRAQKNIVTDNVLKLNLQARDDGGNDVPLPVSWALDDVASGTAKSGESFEVSLAGVPAGVYTLKTSVSERGASGKSEMKILVLRPEDKAVPEGVKRVFLPGPETVNGAMTARFGSGEGTAYAQVALYGDKKTVLLNKSYTAKEMTDLRLDYKKDYPDAVRLQIFWFSEGDAVSYDRQFRREKSKFVLPLTFTRFTDAAYPGTEYTFTLKTAAGVEALAAVWDKSIDAIARNWWNTVSLIDFSVPSVYVSSACGRISGGADEYYASVEEAVLMSPMAKSAGGALRSTAVNAMVMDDAMAVKETAEESSDAEGASEESSVTPREAFESALTFQPHLVSAKDGTLTFSFRTSDKLSTYYVRVYAHTPAMQNAIAEKEMVVSLPVKVSLLEPRYLYEGDTYNAAVTVSSIADEPVTGVIKLAIPGGLIQSSGPVTLAPGETKTLSFPVKVEKSLTLTASFQAAEFSDAVRVKIPVYAPAQTLTEAHSAVLLAGTNREKLLARLRDMFVNVSGDTADLKEITVLDMVKDAIPSHVDPSGRDILSLTEAWYVRLIAEQLHVIAGTDSSFSGLSRESLLKQILACRNSDGGYAWFEGMHSSPVITAVVLERFAKLRDRGFDVPETDASVKYLDGVMFGTQKPIWYGWLSDAQYMHVRAMYTSVPFDVKPVTQADKKRLTEFKKYAKSYLTPSKKVGRGLQGQILAKARRLLTLRNLAASSEGIALAKAWGVGLTTGTKLQKSIKADVTSLLEYAVEHRDGGWYYPNAVMPWRGLLESEAYAHALLSNLLSDDSQKVADGIRLWLMLQKETQKWDEDPAFVDAIDAILKGSQAVLDTRVLALSATYDAPFKDIKAAGNGFTIERKFYRTVVGRANPVEINPGDPVSVGDKIKVQYQIWNGENRSFVKLSAGREATLRPVQQLSGLSGWTLYRNVKAECTEYFWEVCPEEKTTVTEEFYVTQAGSFTAPVTVIESLYAPHYRANSAFRGVLDVR
ncbi:MAG: hypothetical protein K6E61_04400 [Bacteroidales bacterium]|nr:hypothetical protein [Bacteroidales bacterium]